MSQTLYDDSSPHLSPSPSLVSHCLPDTFSLPLLLLIRSLSYASPPNLVPCLHKLRYVQRQWGREDSSQPELNQNPLLPVSLFLRSHDSCTLDHRQVERITYMAHLSPTYALLTESILPLDPSSLHPNKRKLLHFVGIEIYNSKTHNDLWVNTHKWRGHEIQLNGTRIIRWTLRPQYQITMCNVRVLLIGGNLSDNYHSAQEIPSAIFLFLGSTMFLQPATSWLETTDQQ